MPRLQVAWTLGLLAWAAVAVQAQQPAQASDPRNFDAADYGGRIELGPGWLFAPGDDPAFASPALDDRQWKTISAERPLSDYGYHGLTHAWYRIHAVHLRPGIHNLVVGVREVSGSYELYADGVRIGGEGTITGNIERVQERLAIYPVPDDLLQHGGELVLAFRFGLNVAGSRGRGSSNPIDADARISLMSGESVAHETSYVATHRAAANLILAGLGLVVALVAIALFIAMRDQMEYLAATVFLLAFSCIAAVLVWDSITADTIAADLVQTAFFGIATVALIEFVRLVAGAERTAALRVLEILAFAAAFGSPLGRSGFISVYLSFALFFLPILGVDVVLAVMLVRAWRQGNTEARRLIPAVLFYSFAHYWNFGRFAALFLHLTPTLEDMPSVSFLSYDISLATYGAYVFFLAILVFLVRRTFKTARDRARVTAELEAARTTQQLLLTRASEDTPGFAVETVYLPASEVGGDFFFVSPAADGSLLAIVGDVSGKGLIAAMRVAMILGVLRREDSHQPGVILRNLNGALLARPEAGFTTACCVRITRKGGFTLANAGHIAPYIGGREIVIPPALPLGLVADPGYDEVSGQLPPRETLVLLSDGVVEARSAKGELLGFERLAGLSLKTAGEIAETAKAFGQEDDITVLTLACTA